MAFFVFLAYILGGGVVLRVKNISIRYNFANRLNVKFVII